MNNMEEELRLALSAMQIDIRALKAENESLKNTIAEIRAKISSPRVYFENFEGAFKIRTDAEPTSSDIDWKNGTIILTDVGGTKKLFARIGSNWYSVTLT